MMAARIASQKATSYAKSSAAKSDQMRLPRWHNNYDPRMLLILRAITIKFSPWLIGFGKAPAAVG